MFINCSLAKLQIITKIQIVQISLHQNTVFKVSDQILQIQIQGTHFWQFQKGTLLKINSPIARVEN